MEHDVPITQPIILQDATINTSQNDVVRFLPAISKAFQCHSENEKIIEECLETKNDESSSAATDIIANGKYILNAYTKLLDSVYYFCASKLLLHIHNPYFLIWHIFQR